MLLQWIRQCLGYGCGETLVGNTEYGSLPDLVSISDSTETSSSLNEYLFEQEESAWLEYSTYSESSRSRIELDRNQNESLRVSPLLSLPLDQCNIITI